MTGPPELEARPCQAACAWTTTGARLDGRPLFRCGGCGSEWVRGVGWTPVDADGRVPPAVAAEASRS
ncbi:MAG TPA: hypothetical protein VK894_00670 [Jiangellales bacterium]|nr:hypothetical protein [Jiangellales bacterium]